MKDLFNQEFLKPAPWYALGLITYPLMKDFIRLVKHMRKERTLEKSFTETN